MKKIIKGKLYDTETAKLIGTGYATCPRTDFAFWQEDLYRKKTGEYFIFGEGGPLSKYSRHIDYNTRSGGSKITPISYDTAREWAEDNMDADEYIKLFGLVEDDDSTQKVSINLPADLAAKLRSEAESSGKSLTDIIIAHLTK